jgi:hypothetical protein
MGGLQKARAMAMRWRWPRRGASARPPGCHPGRGLDELVRVGVSRRLDDLRGRRAGPAVGDVVADRPAEQERLLGHHAQARAANLGDFANRGRR